MRTHLNLQTTEPSVGKRTDRSKNWTTTGAPENSCHEIRCFIFYLLGLHETGQSDTWPRDAWPGVAWSSVVRLWKSGNRGHLGFQQNLGPVSKAFEANFLKESRHRFANVICSTWTFQKRKNGKSGWRFSLVFSAGFGSLTANVVFGVRVLVRKSSIKSTHAVG